MNTTLFRIIEICFYVAEHAILIDVILSYIPIGRENGFTQLVHAITEPLLSPGRKIQDKLMPGLMIDFSPIIAYFMVYILKQVVFSIML